MRVLFAWHSWVEPENRRLLQCLNDRGAVVTALSPEAWTEGGRLQRAVAGPGTAALPVWRRDHIRSFFYRGGVDRVLREAAPDLVHIFEEPYSLAAFQLVRATMKHAPSARILLHSFENLNVTQPFPFAGFERKTLAAAHGMAVAPEEGEPLWRARGFAGPILKLGHGIDASAYAPKRSDSGSSTVIGYVGRLVPEKGVDTLIEACASLGRAFELWLVGAGPQEMGLRDLADARQVSDRVRFLGSKDKAELASLYSKMDVLVLPSRTTPTWKEQFGRVLVEAMACEVVVVGSSSGEIPAVIGEAGITFPEGNVEALVAALRKLVEDRNLRRRLGQAGRGRVLARYTWESIADRLHAFYTSLLQR